MKRWLLAFCILMFPSFAYAQCTGTAPANTVCGNSTGAAALPKWILSTTNSSIANGHLLANATGGSASAGDTVPTTWFDQAYCNTVGYVVARLTSAWTCSGTLPVQLAWLGVVVDGITDNSSIINTAISNAITASGATSFMLPTGGTICAFSGISVNSGSGTNGDVTIEGSGHRYSALSACGHNVTVVTLNNQFVRLINVAVYGYGNGVSDTFGAATNPAISLGSSCSYCIVRDTYAAFGTTPIQVACSGCRIEDSVFQYAYGDGAHVFGNAYVFNSGQYWTHDSFDQVTPAATPSYPMTAISAWAATTSYSTGKIVSVTCATRSWWIQATVGGTSGGSAPACKNYGQNITDGTVTWQLVNNATSYAMQVDTGANEVDVADSDITGFFLSAFTMTNTYSGAAPTNVTLHGRTTPGGAYTYNVNIQAGSHFTMAGGDMLGCIVSGCAAANIATGVTFARFIGVDVYNGLAYGFIVGSSVTDATFIGNTISQATTNAFVLLGTNDYITGIGNNCHGATAGLSGSPGANGYFPTGTSGNPGC